MEETSNLSEIKKEEMKKRIVERCGSENPNVQGHTCPHCGAREVYADPKNTDDTSKWCFVIGMYKVDDHSKCGNCEKWF